MSTRRLSMSLAAVLVCVGAVSAQTPTQQSTRPADDQKTYAPAHAITVTGCVQKETDVLKADAMPGNAEMGDEFVLTSASLKAKDATAAGAPTATRPESAEANASAAAPGNFGKVYRVTGDKENELKNYVGQRVEIVGSFKSTEDATRELGATGTSGRAPAGDLTKANTPEITITSIAPSTGSCSVGGIK